MYLNIIFKVCYFLQHCAGINCLSVLKSTTFDGSGYLFTGSRDGKLNRWALADDMPSCSAIFESHVDWVILIYLVLLFFSFCLSPL